MNHPPLLLLLLPRFPRHLLPPLHNLPTHFQVYPFPFSLHPSPPNLLRHPSPPSFLHHPYPPRFLRHTTPLYILHDPSPPHQSHLLLQSLPPQNLPPPQSLLLRLTRHHTH